MTQSNAVTMNLSLPDQLRRYVDSKVASGIYGSASEFVREAIREKLQREKELTDAKQMLSQKLLQGLDSGEPIPVTAALFRSKKQKLLHRAGNKKHL